MATTTPSGVRAHAKHGGGSSESRAPMTHRQIMEALSGLLLGMFAAILSSTIVTNALPEIVADLGGGQSAYSWVVTASLLAMTASTPLWGKLADLISKKALVQMALVVFVIGSVVAGLAHNPGTLITARVIQGLGAGGLSALAQIIMAAMISPRERGRYSGYLGATFAVATVGGPLLGGVITDTSWLGWRWCLYVGVPFAVIALLVLQKTLNLPVVKRRVKVDWAGAFFVTAAVCLLLVWVTFADDKYAWLSWQTYTMVGGSVLLTLVFLFVETRAAEPIIPLRLFRNSTITLASLASMFVGIAMFAGTVYFSQYFQLARGQSPTMSGVMTIPMIGGLFVSSTVSGLIITRTGRWKSWLVVGGVLLTAGLGLMGTMRYDTPYWRIALFMGLMGLGVGMMMQNLVLCTQNQVAPGDLGAASSVVTFFRSLGGAAGVSVLGSVMASRISQYATDTIGTLSPQDRAAAAESAGSGAIPDMDLLPPAIRTWLESAYGHGIADIFLYVAPVAFLALLVTLFIKEVPLRTTGALAQAAEASSDTADTAPDAGPRASSEAEADAAADTDSGAGSGASSPAADGATVPSAVIAGAASPVGRADDVPGRSTAVADTTAAVRDTAGGPLTAVATVARPEEPTGESTEDADETTGGAAPAGIPVRGLVRGAEGVPVPHAAVTLISLSGRQLGRSVAQSDGAYAVDAPGAGSYVLIAAAGGHQPQASTVVVHGEPVGHDILLSGTGCLTGVVRAAGDGGPVTGATVIVTDVRGDVLATGTTGADGTFSLTDLVPGTVTVAVNATGYRPRALPVEAGGAGTTGLDVVLTPGARLRGVVRAPHGPLADARVTLVDAAGNVLGTTTTGADGAYAFSDLDGGDYTVIAEGFPPVATALTVDGTGVDGHDIELAHPGE
ncbi:MFS transporter [Streptomyces sp. NPDC101219]|uniref:MFS transporter n=1 Tax=Streptomyces sp. NPDC101219 TaxID=3366131 RepID=UPI00380B1789